MIIQGKTILLKKIVLNISKNLVLDSRHQALSRKWHDRTRICLNLSLDVRNDGKRGNIYEYQYWTMALIPYAFVRWISNLQTEVDVSKK